ncbi:Ig-like domain-containing protein, partial [Cellulosimicrobium cellulans]|uniref:Ig-like domain-containing protein n=1 Tax=Cellulosimicrobium cellulans TaxID=1710 RepID=UPI00209B6B75
LVATVVAASVGVAVLAQPWAAPDAPPAAVAADVGSEAPVEVPDLEPVTSADPPPTEAPDATVVERRETADGPADEPVGADAPPDTGAASEPSTPPPSSPSSSDPAALEPGPAPEPPEPSGPEPSEPKPSEPKPSEPEPSEPQPDPTGPEVPEPAPEPTGPETPEPGPEPSTPPTEPEPEPGPSEPPVVVETAPLVVTTAPPAGTLTVFPVVRGTGEAGALVEVTDARGDVVASATVGTDGDWEIAVTELAATGEHTLQVVQVAEDETSAPATVGPYVFDVPRVLSPAPGALVAGQVDSWSWFGPRYATEVVLDGTPGLRVEAFVDGRPTGTVHTLGDQPLVRQVRDLSAGVHTLALRVVDPGADDPGYGPTVTVPFTLVGLL